MEDLSMISYVIYGVFAFTILFGLLLGLVRGIKRQSFRLITILLSALIAFFVSRTIYPALIKELDAMSLSELLVAMEIDPNGEIAQYLTMDVIKEVMALPVGLLIAPIAFVAIYFVVSIILLIVHKIVCAIIGFRVKNNTGKTRLFGMILGALQGALIGAILMLPVFGIFHTADTAIAEIDTEENESETMTEFLELYGEVSATVNGNLAYRVFGGISGGIYEQLSIVEVGDEQIKMSDMFETVFVIVANTDSLESISFENPTEEDRAVINSLLGTVEDNDYLLTVLASVLRAVSEAKVNEAENAGEDEEQNPLLTDLLSLLTDSTKDTLKTDLSTIKEIYYMLADSGLLVAITNEEGDILAILTEMGDDGDTLIARVSRKIENNTHLAPLSSILVEYAMTLAMAEAGIDEKTAEEVKAIIADVKEGVNDILALDPNDFADDAAYKAEVSSQVDAVLSEHEFELSDEELDTVSTYIIDHMNEIEEVSDADLANLISQYHSASSEGELPEGLPEEIPAA